MVAWSYSALDSFETCPWRHYLTKVSKQVVEPQTEALTWGNQVHKALELRIKSRTDLPSNMVQWEPLAARLDNSARAPGAVVETEQRMALNAEYRPTTYFAEDVWVRSITDITIVREDRAFIGDYKTGAPKPDSAQLRLTAAVTMHHKPYVNSVTNSFIWLKTNTLTTERFTRADLPTIWQEFAPRVQRFEAAIKENKFPKRPSGLCKKWCPVPLSMCEHRA